MILNIPIMCILKIPVLIRDGDNKVYPTQFINYQLSNPMFIPSLFACLFYCFYSVCFCLLAFIVFSHLFILLFCTILNHFILFSHASGVALWMANPEPVGR